MALHPDFPGSPNAILDPDVRWFPADEALRDATMGKVALLFGNDTTQVLEIRK